MGDLCSATNAKPKPKPKPHEYLSTLRRRTTSRQRPRQGRQSPMERHDQEKPKRGGIEGRKGSMAFVCETSGQPMTPVQQIARLYAKGRRSLADDARAFMRTGYVIDRPDCFLMGKPVIRDAPLSWLIDPNCRFPLDADCWLVWAAAGSLPAIIEAIPYPLPWVAWSRRGKHLRFWRLESTIRHAARIGSSAPSVLCAAP